MIEKEKKQPIRDFLDRIDGLVLDNPSRVAAMQIVERTALIENRMLHGGENFKKENIPETFQTLSEMSYLSLDGKPATIKESDDGNAVSATFNQTPEGKRISVSVEGIRTGILELIFSDSDNDQDSKKKILVEDPNYLVEKISREIASLRVGERHPESGRKNLE